MDGQQLTLLNQHIDLVSKNINTGSNYGNNANFIAGHTASITGTADTSVIASQGMSARLYITQIIVTNGHASVGTYVNIKDNSTTIYTGYASPAGGGFSLTFTTPLKLSLNSPLQVANETNSSDVRVSASGYIGA